MGSESAPPKFQKAIIYTLNKQGEKTGKGFEVMFNPYEYKVSKTNNYNATAKNATDAPKVKFTSAGSQTLSLSLVFDSYENFDSNQTRRVDVSKETRKLWNFMMTRQEEKNGKKKKFEPPEVAFEWGVFYFRAFVTNMTQTFTMFDVDGTPLRAKVDVTFTQYKDENDYPNQGATKSHTTYERTWRVTAGDRLDTIAGEVYGDPGQWRRIAEHNQIVDPLALSPGQRLRIPVD
jgi:nucleoid-associated protein YgaU